MITILEISIACMLVENVFFPSIITHRNTLISENNGSDNFNMDYPS